MSMVKKVPVISTTAITCATTVNSTTVTSSAAFGSVVAGQRIVGAGIPFNTTVASKTDSSTIIISKAATATAASVSLRFGYFTSAIYAAGDTLGFPFYLPVSKINNIYVIDNDKVITAVKLVIFSDEFTETADNAAFAPSDADAAKIIGYVSLATSETLGNNTIVTQASTALPLDVSTARGDKRTCQLVCVGTPTFTAVDSLAVIFMGD